MKILEYIGLDTSRVNEQRAALERWREQRAATRHAPQPGKPRWGTAETRRMEIERMRREREERRKR